jgi:hypothetical protein
MGMEKRLIQIVLAFGGLIAVGAGMVGGLRGTLMLGDWGDASLDSHFRYLSGLLLGVGVAYWSVIPDIEHQEARLGLLTLMVVTGGFFSALGLLANGAPDGFMRVALVLELAGAPLLYLWQRRIARLTAVDAAPQGR